MKWRSTGLVWIGLAGCYSPHPPTGAPCDPALDNCPEGQMCIAQGSGYVCLDHVPGVDAAALTDGPAVADGSPDGPPDDVDGDGVLNADDNCPTRTNPSQANEDGDALGDACDPCPPHANNTDGDADGVGDLCDPNPTVGGDQLVLFEGFADGIPPSWENVGGWTVSGGDASIVSADGAVAVLGPPMTATAHGMSSLAFVPTQLFGTAGKGFGVSNPSESATAAAGSVCELLHNAAAGPGGGIANLTTGLPVAQMPLAWATGDEMTVVFDRLDTMFDCTVSTTSSSITVPDTRTLAVTQPVIAIRTKSVSGRAHWLMYVTSP